MGDSPSRSYCPQITQMGAQAIPLWGRSTMGSQFRGSRRHLRGLDTCTKPFRYQEERFKSTQGVFDLAVPQARVSFSSLEALLAVQE